MSVWLGGSNMHQKDNPYVKGLQLFGEFFKNGGRPEDLFHKIQVEDEETRFTVGDKVKIAPEILGVIYKEGARKKAALKETFTVVGIERGAPISILAAPELKDGKITYPIKKWLGVKNVRVIDSNGCEALFGQSWLEKA